MIVEVLFNPINVVAEKVINKWDMYDMNIHRNHDDSNQEEDPKNLRKINKTTRKGSRIVHEGFSREGRVTNPNNDAPYSLLQELLATIIFAPLALSLFIVSGCLHQPILPPNPSEALLEANCPPFADTGDLPSLKASIDQSLGYYSNKHSNSTFGFGSDTYSREQLITALTGLKSALAATTSTAIANEYIGAHFRCYRPNAEDLLVTGYFESSLKGSRKKSEKFKYPLYGVPPSLLTVDLKAFFPEGLPKGAPNSLRARVTKDNHVVPFYTRREIDIARALPKTAPVIAWVDDPLALFFLHIQGSGVISLVEGGEIHVNFSDINGHPYKAIGALLLREGKLPKERVSMQTIIAYLQEHPEEAERVLSYNESYVFFREVKVGPIGSIQVPLTPLRSIASDSTLFPKGALAYLSTNLGTTPFSQFVLNQDTGGAIKGPGHVDLFTGKGEQAEKIAGTLNAHGAIYFLAPK